MRFCVVNLGCKVNRVESDSIAAALQAAGWTSGSDADIVVVNTCTVTAEADRKTRKAVHQALERHPGAQVIVTGCAASLDPGVYERMSARVAYVDKARVVQACLEHEDPQHEPAEVPLRVGEGFPTRVGIKVQDGCDNACTFCIVHVARGPATSVPIEQCVRQARSYAQAGVRELVLTGIDLGAYRSDGKGLADLVGALRAAVPETRIRISSIEPNTIDDALVDALSSNDGMVCRHLHIPLQSGSSKVLREMARRYDAHAYRARIESLRQAVPGIAITTDVIVGFPGETDEDFSDTLQMCEACGFSRIHVFRYSRRAGTPAAERTDQVAPEVGMARARKLDALAAQLRSADAASRVGSVERVLVESDGRGMTESYYPVTMNGSYRAGDLVAVRLAHVGKDGCFTL